ncbi:MAG TPA: hypothetical protein VHQ20_01650 [Patescibacteria group bacterium]|jgi:hypothetical protein|nr:hypothetical protein [Patescibacteria group bacterium]
MNKKYAQIILPVAALIVGLGVAGGIAVHAAGTSATGQTTNPVSNLVNAIAQKFNLNTADVQKVFDDNRAQMEAQHQQMFADRLSAAVTAGTITQDQADKITAKMKELQAKRDADKANFANMTQAQRQAQMQQDQTDLKQWATDNNIPQQFIPMGGGFRGHGGPGMKYGGHRGGPDGDADDAGASAPTTSTTTN